MKNEEILKFKEEVRERLAGNGNNRALVESAQRFVSESTLPKYSYNFEWLGRPIIQYPQDIVAMEEIIWRVKPDLIIETGIAHGGSLIFSASMLTLLDVCDAIEQKKPIDPAKSGRKVLAVDIDIRAHNREAIEAHPMASRIEMIQGSSIAPEVVAQVKAIAANYRTVLLCLDSNHTHEHVLEELTAYAPLVTKGSYCVVFDTIIEDLQAAMFAERPWGPANNPKTAVMEFLRSHPEFTVDKSVDNKLLISVAPDGYLLRCG
jgi:cephalosporin hydroxylase